MNYLLDTHIYLWWLNNDKNLTESAKKIIEDPGNTIFVSIVSFWEISIKLKTKKLPLKTSLVSLYENLQFNFLTLKIEHVLEHNVLPLHHKDPFDRMIIAQAISENYTIITSDEKIKKYQVKVV